MDIYSTEYAISIAGAEPRHDDHLHPDEIEHLVLGVDESLVQREVSDWRPVG